jgi:hypothetical protein
MTRPSHRPRLRPLLVACALALGLVAAAPRAAHAQFGVAGGLNFASLGDISTNNLDANFENSTAYHVGIFYDASFGPLAVRPGVFFKRVGQYEISDPSLPGTESFNVSSIEIPIDVRYTLLPVPVVSPYVLAAPVFAIPRGEDEFGDALNDVALSADVGLGTEISLPGVPVTPLIELRYSFGISSYVGEDFEVGDTSINVDDSERLNAFMLRVGVKF